MHYAVVNAPPGSSGNAYRFFKFKALSAAHKCPLVDEFALVYEVPEQLQQLCPADDLRAILIACGVEVPDSATHIMLANALHRLVEENATSWAKESAQNGEPEMASVKKAKKAAAPKKAKAKKAPAPKKERKVPLQAKLKGRMAREGRIKKLGTNPAREGTNRYANLEVILAAKTVEEALRNLRNLPKPGGMVDIRFAIANGLIEVADNG